MSMTGDVLGTGVSALLATQRALSTTGHNISNVNTEGFSRQRVDLDARTPTANGAGFIGNGVNVTSIQRMQNAFLEAQVRTSTTAFTQLDTLHDFASRVDNLLADSSAGLGPALEAFFGTVQDVADDPTSGAARQAMLSGGEALVNRFHYMDQRLADLDESVNTDLETVVTEINSLANAIAQANHDIIVARGAASGQPPNDLLDQRDALITQLSEKVGVSTLAEGNGAVNVFIGNGQSLVVGAEARQLEIRNNAYDGDRAEVAFAPPFSSPVISDFLTGGQLGGILAFRGEVLDPARNGLGRVALGLAATFNDQHQLGQDQDGNAGGDFFTEPSPTALGHSGNTSSTNVTLGIDDAGDLTTADYLLRFDGVGSWSLTNLDTDQSVTMSGSGTDADPFVADGLSISVQAIGAGGGDSYRFLIRPTRAAAENIDMTLSDPAAIAAAAPVRASASTNNSGDAGISAPSVNTPPPPDANLGQTVTITFDDPPTTFDVNGTGTGNPTNVAFTDGADITYNGWTLQISGSPAAGDVFTVSANTNGVGDNRNALLLAGLQRQSTLGGSNVSYQEAYAQVVSETGARTHEASVNRDAQESLRDLAMAQRDSVSGVNLDEEAANLLRFQQAYQAAAQVINIADLMFEELLGVMRR